MISGISLYIKTLAGIYHWERMRECPFCGGIEFKPHSRYRVGPLILRLQSCTYCGLIAQNPRLSSDSLARFYRSEYRSGMKDNGRCERLFERGIRRGAYICDFLSKNEIRYKSAVVFEVGCSYGGILEQFRRQGCRVQGCDLDEASVRYGVTKGLDLEVGSIDKLKKAGCKADIMILSHVLEHIPDPVLFIKDVKSLLNPGGMLYIEVPGIKNVKSKEKRYVQPGHLIYFNLDTLKKIANSAGFDFVSGNESIQTVFRNEKRDQE